MKGLLILPKAKMLGKEKPSKEYEDDEDEMEGEEDDGEDFNALFNSFISALGLEPEDSAKAAKRFKALIGMACSKYMG